VCLTSHQTWSAYRGLGLYAICELPATAAMTTTSNLSTVSATSAEGGMGEPEEGEPMSPPNSWAAPSAIQALCAFLLVAFAGCSRSPEPTQVAEVRSALVTPQTPEQAAVRNLQERAQNRATIDDLKARIAPMPDSPERRALQQQLRSTLEGYVAGMDGRISPKAGQHQRAQGGPKNRRPPYSPRSRNTT
jgi:hypothetical protein